MSELLEAALGAATQTNPIVRRRLKQIGERENRWMTDANHQVSRALVTRYGANTLFVLEDLTVIREATEKGEASTTLCDGIMGIPPASGDGDVQVAVGESVDDCRQTAKRNRDRRKHRFRCQACGYASNDDRIGAMYLCQKGTEYLLPDAGSA